MVHVYSIKFYFMSSMYFACKTILKLESAKQNCSRRFLFLDYFSEKIKLDISCESSALQTNHMKC